MPAVGDDELLVRVQAASVNPLDWHFMRGVLPVIDRTYPLDQIADAMRYLEEGHATGKVIVSI